MYSKTDIEIRNCDILDVDDVRMIYFTRLDIQFYVFSPQESEVFMPRSETNDVLPNAGVPPTSRDVALVNSEQSLVSTREKSTPEKVCINSFTEPASIYLLVSFALSNPGARYCESGRISGVIRRTSTKITSRSSR